MTCRHSVGRHIAWPAGSGRHEARSPTCFYSQSLLQRANEGLHWSPSGAASRAKFIEAAGEAQDVSQYQEGTNDAQE